MLKYAAFTQSEGGTWPAWEAVGEGTWLSPPTASNMETYAEERYKEVKLYVYKQGRDSHLDMLFDVRTTLMPLPR